MDGRSPPGDTQLDHPLPGGWLVGVDVGGTFTDFQAFHGPSGRVVLHKTPSTPDNPAEAILTGLSQLAALDDAFSASGIGALAHGTTVATNTLIQRSGARVAMLCTRNFRDLVEIGRQVRPKLYDLGADHPPPLAPRARRFELHERIGPAGEVITPLDDRSLDAAITRIADSGAEAVAVCLLFSYLNPAHEQTVKAQLAEALPGVAVSISSEVQPEFREYERGSTALLNAYLQPAFARYMNRLKGAMAEMAPGARLGINQSSGGLMSVERAQAFPIRTALSGPAAGSVGAIQAARASGLEDVITFDMGGTSADVALIRDGQAALSFDRDVAGFPVRMPMVDINTVGAGGGSIAWIDRDGLVKVGPRSAGAVPGPACYGRGGTEPTVTDANVVLGRLAGHGLLGGAMALDEAAAHAAVGRLAEAVGLSPVRAAQGILEIVSANMVRAIRAISVERGHDPRDFALMAFGGAGPLHAEGCARALGIRRILVPMAPGILCAQGLLMADLSESFVRSQRMAVEEADRLAGLLAEMGAEAEAWWRAEGVVADRRRLRIALDMRYAGQNYDLQVALPEAGAKLPALPGADTLRALFFEAHDRAYGFHNPEDRVLVTALRLTAVGRLPSPGTPPVPEGASRHPAPRDRRAVWFDGAGPEDTAIYDRATLAPGAEVAGPAVIDQFDATTLVYPGAVARVDGALGLIIDRGEAA
ncbi:MAG: hydantoinase/oxoprolinase family protein [Alkalilacustris sp.]